MSFRRYVTIAPPYRRGSVDFAAAASILPQYRTKLTATLPIYYCSIDYILVSYLLRCDSADLAASIASILLLRC